MIRPPVIDMAISQILFWGITLLSLLTLYQIRKANNVPVRFIFMSLLATMAWRAGASGLYYLLWDFGYFDNFPEVFIRIVANVPLFWSLSLLYRYVRFGK